MNSLVAELLKNSMEELILMVYLLFRNIYIANEYILEMYIFWKMYMVCTYTDKKKELMPPFNALFMEIAHKNHTQISSGK